MWIFLLGSTAATTDLKSTYPNFYVSSWSSPSTPIPSNRLPLLESHSSRLENKNAAYPVSFSQRLRESNLNSNHEKTSRGKSRSSSLTAFERAKLMMRLRGGNEARDVISKTPKNLDRTGGDKLYDKSGKSFFMPSVHAFIRSLSFFVRQMIIRTLLYKYSRK